MANYGQPKRFCAKMLPKSNKIAAVAKIATKVAINLTVEIIQMSLHICRNIGRNN